MSHGRLSLQAVEQMGIAMATTRLLAAGYGVALPVVDAGFDLLVYRRRRVWRVQVNATAASGRHERSRVRIRCGNDKRLRYSPHTIDAVIAVHVTRNLCVCVPMRWLTERSTINFHTFSDYQDFSALMAARPPKRKAT